MLDEDEPIVTFKASKSGNIGTLKQPSKKVTVSTQSSMKASTLPRTPSKKRNPRLESSDEKPKSAKKPRFYVDNETGKKEEGSSKHVGQLLSPVIIALKKSRSDTNCEVTNIEDADEYLKDTYSGLTPLSAVAVVTGASSSEEKMVSLKDWAADEGKDYKSIRIMPIPVEYEQFAAFVGEVFRLKNVIMPLWNGGLEFKTMPSAKPGTPQSSPTRGVTYKSRLNVTSSSTSNQAALNANDEVPIYNASSGNFPFQSIVNLSDIPQYRDAEVPTTTPVIVCFTVNTYSGQNGISLSLNLHWVAVLM
ncbi:hypothetical protein JAAARDRAFT_200696 [Jaapia argillacea MUCL 33604]|uniref:Uncharacterized protein n=1 Tax=Jaapia argillacea MUCL 33604 TaxID=933084 RepID=A0A067P735_9AGAM|nr:hypothetical protein JAAARDRAFT_200696 [Jaapia argillacea MUCL 33604]